MTIVPRALVAGSDDMLAIDPSVPGWAASAAALGHAEGPGRAPVARRSGGASGGPGRSRCALHLSPGG